MLLDDKQVAINELVAAYQEAADHYESAIGQLDDEALARLFETIRAQHVEATARLAAIVRASGELPRAPHADKEEVRQLLTALKTAFSEDRRKVILEERMEDEKALENALEEALALDFPDDTVACLDTLRTTQQAIIGRLGDTLNDRSGGS